MNNYNKLQKYLENRGNATVILSFDTLKEILGIEVNYTAALCIKKDFHCSYVVDDVSEKEKWIRFCRTETQNDEDTTITTLASMLSYSYKNRIWESDGRIVAFCFYENPRTDIYFCLRPGYGELAQEMIQYAAKNMPDEGAGIRLVLFGGQDELMESAKRLGYRQESESWNMQFDFVNKLDYPLPEGFHFVRPRELDTSKVGECCWKGFDHEKEEGAWNHQYQQNFYLLEVAPHATKNLSVAVANEEGAYVCWAGMWWTPENKLAYLEPLCTIPEYRRKGLAAAALSELYRKTKALGATHMSGGESEFYRKIGYIPAVKWTFWKKETEYEVYNNPWNEITLTDYESHMLHWKKRRGADYIVVLGAGVIGTRVTPLLAARIERGIELLHSNPGAVLIMSGGQGPGEDIAEGEAMARYAEEKGVGIEKIIIESRSKSTEENLLFSSRLMEKDRPKVVVVTTSYHVFRALLLAKQQGLKCVGFGAKTKWYFTLNALIREFAGYLRLTWKRHIFVAAAIIMIVTIAI